MARVTNWPSTCPALPNRQMSPRGVMHTQNNNIKIKWCTYLSKPMLKHHFPAKFGHSIKKKNFAGHVLGQFVTPAIGVNIYCINDLIWLYATTAYHVYWNVSDNRVICHICIPYYILNIFRLLGVNIYCKRRWCI
jgi:hypothetical protein